MYILKPSETLAWQEASVGGLFSKDTEIKPIREEPTVVTRDDVMRYLLDLIIPLVGSLKKYDAWKHLAWGNPLELEFRAADDLLEAESLDGCSATDTPSAWDGTGCPILSEAEDVEAGDGDTPYRIARRANPLWKAQEDRRHALVLLNMARDLRRTAKDRKLKTLPVEDELKLWANVNALWTRSQKVFDRINKSITTSADDFREIQGLDVDMQTMRRQYTAFTGLQPTMALPSHVKGGESKGLSQIPWKMILVVAGLAAAAIVVINLKPLLTSIKPGPSPRPLPA